MLRSTFPSLPVLHGQISRRLTNNLVPFVVQVKVSYLLNKWSITSINLLKGSEGIPNLRRGIRSRYASVSLPQIDESVQKLLKSGRDFDDALLSIIIKNLKNV